MSEPTIDEQGNVILGSIVCTDCGGVGNKYTSLCDSCEEG